ncbi:MAG: hypothetical protein BI182_06335 [Acetobacterium sp. MES1]|uniref:type II secretion system protein n=1 Tax=Acetobacterium sp. MES1 TaxID=1899015 RepID=UPI000B9D38BA|nr:type II secretion system protein [Acetobacterium sp. MES1]OXS27076.1 MAG: hypothetical protein BI182_06335 [Acetobacterium sp. MES1]
MELINKIRRSRKGFTLVEIIVVLVILAVLAAFTIPSMIGFVKDAKKKAAIAEQREVYVAAQAIATEYFAKDKANANTNLNIATPAAAGAIAVNLGSDVLKGADTDAEIAALPEAARKMLTFLGTDIKASEDAGATDSLWVVKIGTDGQVKEVTYTRDGEVLDPLKPNSKFE